MRKSLWRCQPFVLWALQFKSISDAKFASCIMKKIILRAVVRKLDSAGENSDLHNYRISVYTGVFVQTETSAL